MTQKQIVGVWISSKMLSLIDDLIRSRHYRSRSDFFRQSALEQLRKEILLSRVGEIVDRDLCRFVEVFKSSEVEK